jgi:hypothetical protein
LFVDPKTELKNFAGDEAQMRVQHFAEQKLGPGVDDDNAHRRRFNAQRSTSNAQRPNGSALKR